MPKRKKSKPRSTKPRQATNAQVVSKDDGKERCWLFRLPPEIRYMIYSELFHDTRITHGKRKLSKRERVQILPDPNALSLLRTCRRIRNEVGDRWMNQILFNFEDVKTMMTKLGSISASQLSRIRHVRVREDTLRVDYGDLAIWDEGPQYYRLVQILRLLPGLRLDCLTVLNKYGATVSYDTVSTLIKYGQGWRELRFISHTSALLGWYRTPGMAFGAPDGENFGSQGRYRRQRQPDTWRKVLRARDESSESPTVEIYRSIIGGAARTVTRESTRVPFEQKCGHGFEKTSAGYASEEFSSLMSPEEKTKELMVIARRGKGVDFEQKPGHPYLHKIREPRLDVTELLHSSVWEDYMLEDESLDMEDDSFEAWDPSYAQLEEMTSISDSEDDWEDPHPTKLPTLERRDIYEHADDYEWTQLNFEPIKWEV